MLARNTQDIDNFLTFGTVNTFRYTNYRGEVSMRKVVPLHLRYGKHTDCSTKDEWLVECFDLDKKDYRTFALANIEPR